MVVAEVHRLDGTRLLMVVDDVSQETVHSRILGKIRLRSPQGPDITAMGCTVGYFSTVSS